MELHGSPLLAVNEQSHQFGKLDKKIRVGLEYAVVFYDVVVFWP